MKTVTRRHWLKSSAVLAAGSAVNLQAATAAEAAENAHREIWRRFIDEHGILVDYTDLEGNSPRYTAGECREGKPNALAWWTAHENGAMFNGDYMEALCLRWKRTGAAEDREKARRLAQGLIKLASTSSVKGFIARGLATDGKACPPMGSNDQSGPWFYGLWRYAQIAEGAEKEAIIAKMLEVAKVLEASAWRMPCDTGAPSQFRGTFAGFAWEFCPRLLFLLKAMYHLTGEVHWFQLYHAALQERGGEGNHSRLEICEAGMHFDGNRYRQSWTGASSNIGLRGLYEIEDDPTLKAIYAKGLANSAKVAAEGLVLCEKFNVETTSAFQYDWRVLNPLWVPQKSEAEAVALAERQAKELGKLSPRRREEFEFVREPAFAAWNVTLCPHPELVETHRAAIEKVIGWYRYDRLYYSQFFPVESAWERLQIVS